MNLFRSKNANPVPTRKQIAACMQSKGQKEGLRYRCPVCRNSRWDVAGVRAFELEPDTDDRESSRTFVPTAVLICGNCAFCAQFSLVALGLLTLD